VDGVPDMLDRIGGSFANRYFRNLRDEGHKIPNESAGRIRLIRMLPRTNGERPFL
jgi:hypothetical protein